MNGWACVCEFTFSFYNEIDDEMSYFAMKNE